MASIHNTWKVEISINSKLNKRTVAILILWEWIYNYKQQLGGTSSQTWE